MSEQITAVTPQLASAMTRAAAVFKGIEAATQKPKDLDSYAEVCGYLEDLTMAVLGSTSSLSLINVRPTGARFDIGYGTDLAEHVTESVEYLRNTASELIRSGNLSKYESSHTDRVASMLRIMYRMITGAIVRQAKADLDSTWKDGGPEMLLKAADLLADLADPKPLTPAEDARTGSEMFPQH